MPQMPSESRSATVLCPSAEFGSKTSQTTLVFVSGFPDDHTGWLPIVDALLVQARCDCRIICLSMPYFDSPSTLPVPAVDCDESPVTPTKTTGIPVTHLCIKDVLAAIHATINLKIGDSQKFYLIAHDWGAFFAYHFAEKYPQRLHGLLTMDIGIINTVSSIALEDVPRLVLYQWWFAISFFIWQWCSQTLGALLFRLFAFLPVYFQPCGEDIISRPAHRPANEIKVHMCYLYYHVWVAFLFNWKKHMTASFPSCRFLYLFGTKKNIMYHNQAFLDQITAAGVSASKWKQSGTQQQLAGRCSYREIASAGHWIHLDAPDIVAAEIVTFCRLTKR